MLSGWRVLFWIVIKVSLQSLWSAKLRSVLAILGIIMGVGAVISMLSIVEGARQRMEHLIGGLGTDVLFVWPSYRSAQGKGSVPRLTLADAEGVLAGAEDVVRVSPIVESYSVVQNGNKNVRVSINGVAPTYNDIRNRTIAEGRNFSDTEVEQEAQVAVLGSKTAEKLFGAVDPLGKIVKIDQHAFRVVGILQSIGAEGFSDGDNLIMVPFTTLERESAGRHADLSEICIQGASSDRMKMTENEIRVVLRKNHKIKSTAKDDFGIFNQASLLEAQNKAMRVFTIVLGGVGGICLLTGGIGIMNIMLVIVTERTKEIGLRKALGARGRDILRQFLLEAVLISVLGGVMGVIGGMGLSVLIKALTELETKVSVGSIVLSLGFATAIGVFFGFYPAWRAARLNPIEALARE
jgi:putative ABC transport system permease protein